MNKAIAKFTTFFFTAAVALASAIEPYANYQVEVGYRRDDLKLKSSDTFLGFDIHGKEKFKDLDIFTLGLEIKALIPCWIYGRGNVDYGWICGEHDRDEYKVEIQGSGGNLRTGAVTFPETDRALTHRRVRGKYVADLSAAFGYPFEFFCSKLMIAPIVGYSYNEQKLHSRYHQSISFPLPNTSAFESNFPVPQLVNFDDVYRKVRAAWWGPFVGFDIDYLVGCGWKVYGEFEYHFGTAKLSTRTHFSEASSNAVGAGFFHESHRKRAHGVNLRIGTNYLFWCNWLLGLHVDYKNWRSTHGSDTHLDWQSYGVGVDLGYSF